jgi:hypothetical protein
LLRFYFRSPQRLAALYSALIKATAAPVTTPRRRATDAHKKQFRDLVGGEDALDDLALIACDEGSFLDCAFFHYMNRRMQDFRGNRAPFGGLVVVIYADFYQLTAIGGIALNKGLVALQLTDEVMIELGLAKKVKNKLEGALSASGCDRKGALMFSKFPRYILTEPMRTSKDQSFTFYLYNVPI